MHPEILISQKLIDFTIECEVSSKAYFIKCLRHPEWPGGRSGVTEGIGYDLGYADEAKLTRDWVPVMNDIGQISLMRKCLGVRGQAAKLLLPSVRKGILIEWEQATKVFLERDVPEYTDQVLRAIPEARNLPPDCLGVLFSIGYNRGNGGWTSSNPRFYEMNKIREAIQNGHPERVPDLIRSMKRLWPSNDRRSPDRGLRARRDREAKLFEQGLKKSEPAATIPVAKEKPPRTMPAAPATAAEHGSAAGTVVTVGSAANDAASAGASSWEIAAIVIGGIILAFVVWKIVNAYRTSQNPTLARAKDAEPDGVAPIAA